MAEDFERLAKLNEQLAKQYAEAADNGMVDPAPTDLDESEDAPEVELSEEEKYAALNACVTHHPLNRELYLRVLRYCEQERELHDIEQQMETFPEFPRCTMNQYYMVKSLVSAYGLEFIERTEDGVRVTPEMKEGLTEDEIDDLVFSFNYVTTPLGLRLVDERSPRKRLEALLEWEPSRRATYVQVLDYIAEQPRDYAQIESLLKGSPALETIINGRIETVQPSVFLDKLERAGVLVWNKKWQITEEGSEYLREMRD